MRDLKTELQIAGWLIAWPGIVAVRAIFTEPPQPAWFVGIIAAGIATGVVGWLARGYRDRRAGAHTKAPPAPD